MKNLIRIFFFLVLNMAFNIDSHARSNLIFSENFEEESLNNWERQACVSCPHAINVVNSKARSGQSSSRFELRKNDSVSSVGSKRAELSRIENEPGEKHERWYGFSIFLPEDYDYDAAEEIVTQWHASPDHSPEGNQIEDWRSPPLALLTSKGKWEIDFRWDTNKITVSEPEYRNQSIGTYEREKWTDWVFHVKWSYEEDGLLEIWKNGIRVFTRSGPIGFNDDAGVYMKTGIYKWLWEESSEESNITKRIMYVDEIYIGNKNASFSDVSPAITDGFILPNNQWRQISLPAVPPSNNNTVSDIFADELGNGYGSDWILYSYDPLSNSYVDPGPNGILKQGIGYWIIQVTGAPVTLALPSASTNTPVVLSSKCVSTKGCYEIELATASDDIQWNMIGYPFRSGNNLNRVRVVTNDGVCANGCSLDAAKDANIFHNKLWSYDGNQLSAFISWNGFWGVTLQSADTLAPKLLIPVD